LIPVGVNGFFHWHNPSGRTIALQSTQASNRNVGGGVTKAGA